jgi:hypothetical protein
MLRLHIIQCGSEVTIHFNVLMRTETGFNRCFPPKSVLITTDLKSAIDVAFSNTDIDPKFFKTVCFSVRASVQHCLGSKVVNLNIKMVLTEV